MFITVDYYIKSLVAYKTLVIRTQSNDYFPINYDKSECFVTQGNILSLYWQTSFNSLTTVLDNFTCIRDFSMGKIRTTKNGCQKRTHFLSYLLPR